MPPRRDLQQGDIAARQLFGGISQFPTFGSLAQTAQRLQNVIPSPSSLAATGISALRNIAASTPLIGRRQPMAQPTTPSATQLPSGTIAGGFDIYPTTPQMAPRTASATAPQPAAPSLAAPTTIPSFPATGMGLMGNQNIRPLPTEQIAPMASISRIEGGPASMNIAGPITAEAQGRQAIQTPRGTIYATAQQAESFNAPRTAATASTRSPAEQQALLSQVRASGQNIARNYEDTMRKFGESRGPRFASMPAPQGMFGQPLTDLFPQSQEAIAQRSRSTAPVLAATGFGETQRSIGQSPALRGPLAELPSLISAGRSPYSGLGIGGLIAGGPQTRQASQLPMAPMSTSGQLMSRPSQYSNTRAEQRNQIRQLQELSRMGLI